MEKPHVLLLNNLFKEFNKNIKYVVLRNYEKLPDYYGNDVDILITKDQESEVFEIVEEIVRDCGLQISRVVKRYCYNGVYIKLSKSGDEILIDFYTDLVKAWFKYANAHEVLNNRVKFNNRFYVPLYEHELAIVIFKELFAYGFVREKYSQLIYKSSKVNEKKFKDVLKGLYRNDFLNIVLNVVVKDKNYFYTSKILKPKPSFKNYLKPISAMQWLFNRF